MTRRRSDKEIRRVTAAGIVRHCPDCDAFLPENRATFYYHLGPDGKRRAHTYCKDHERDRARLAYQRRCALAGKAQRVQGAWPRLPEALAAYTSGVTAFRKNVGNSSA